MRVQPSPPRDEGGRGDDAGDTAETRENTLMGRSRQLSRQAGLALNQLGAVTFDEDAIIRQEGAAPSSNPTRAKALWGKLAANRKSYDGNNPASPNRHDDGDGGDGGGASTSATHHSAFWRLRNGVAAFLHIVDRDVDGKRKSKADALNKAAQKLRDGGGLRQVRRHSRVREGARSAHPDDV